VIPEIGIGCSVVKEETLSRLIFLTDALVERVSSAGYWAAAEKVLPRDKTKNAAVNNFVDIQMGIGVNVRDAVNLHY
jgi:hypothetical protein